MVCARKDRVLRRFQGVLDLRPVFRPRVVLIGITQRVKLRTGIALELFPAGLGNNRRDKRQRLNPAVPERRVKSDAAAERVTGNPDLLRVDAGLFRDEIDRGDRIGLLAAPAAVTAFARVDAAEVKAERGNTVRKKRPVDREKHVVVHVPAVKRVRVAKDNRRTMSATRWHFEDAFQHELTRRKGYSFRLHFSSRFSDSVRRSGCHFFIRSATSFSNPASPG